MTNQKKYHFSTTAQWKACVFAGTSLETVTVENGFGPTAPFGQPPTRYASPGAFAPVILSTGETLWRDEIGQCHQLLAEGGEAESFPSPSAIATAERMVATADLLWVRKGKNSVQCFESDSLTQFTTISFKDGDVIDIAAADDQGSLYVLIQHNNSCSIKCINRCGFKSESIPLNGLLRVTSLDSLKQTSFVYLKQTKQFTLLTRTQQPVLLWFAEEGGDVIRSMPVGAIRPSFRDLQLGCDFRHSKLLLSGIYDDISDKIAAVLVLDPDGGILSEVIVDRSDAPIQIQGVTGGCSSLLVAGSSGLQRYRQTNIVPLSSAEVRAYALTPMLRSTPLEGGPPWLRAEFKAELPQGSTLKITVAATDDDKTRERILSITRNNTLLADHLVKTLHTDPDLHRNTTIFQGRASNTDVEPESFSAPLFTFKEQYLWVSLELIAAPGAKLPVVYEMNVLYPGISLMEHLPLIYQREPYSPDNFLRALVGVLENSSQEIDQNIASLGSLIHPTTAPEEWLDYVARWLGLPWQDQLNTNQKRAILSQAEILAQGRGTRFGLEALLKSIITGEPPRFRVIDMIADFGFAITAADNRKGTNLPAILGGASPWNSELDAFAVVDVMRLPCSSITNDPMLRFLGKIRIDIAATAQERIDWEPWLLDLLQEMAPVMTTVELNWVGPQALKSDRIHDDFILEPLPDAHLGSDAVTGHARLPDAKPRLSDIGPTLDTRLH
ncbi:phage tail protein [Gimesia fumaroli]|uniref:Phage tail protein n=1 Tax=Gimesia fumaroli TaxID=2527976 RepID=A0A518IA62_9PLAN|nr:phage tail protein [Gimesia fumaroli]QDV49902.1 Phage tail protein [Gimesia fumaroli]